MWWEENATLLAEERKHISENYPALKFHQEGDMMYLRGPLQIADIANGRKNEQALSAIFPVERGYNINKINLGAIVSDTWSAYYFGRAYIGRVARTCVRREL